MLYTTPVLATAPSRTLDLETREESRGSDIFVGKNRNSLPNLSVLEFVAPLTAPGLEIETFEGVRSFTDGITPAPSFVQIVNALTPVEDQIWGNVAA